MLSWLARWLEKAVFALLVILALQLPILSHQYQQYLAGYIDALENEVRKWNEISFEFGFSSIDKFIAHLASNEDKVVKADAENKRDTLSELRTKRQGLAILKNEHYFKKLLYILSPQNLPTLKDVSKNFEPGIPLTLDAILFSLLVALCLNLLFITPCKWINQLFQKRHKQNKHYI